MLVDLAHRNVVPVVGLNYKEVRGDGQLDARGMAGRKPASRWSARGWLGEHGSPHAVGARHHGTRVDIDFGVYGVPRPSDRWQRQDPLQHIGPITPENLQQVILPKVSTPCRLIGFRFTCVPCACWPAPARWLPCCG